MNIYAIYVSIMETTELRYFLAVAKTENMHRASEELGVSPGSLSKAVSKLERELGVSLFYREGRNIKLTSQGLLLKRRGNELSQFERSIKNEIQGEENALTIRIGGPEYLLGYFFPKIQEPIRTYLPKSNFTFEIAEARELQRKIEEGELDLGLSTYAPGTKLDSKILGQFSFETFIGKGHPLFRKRKSTLPVEEILQYDFALPSNPFLGRIEKSDSPDGWRDDKFPRKKAYSCQGLHNLIELTKKGLAISYLPTYFAAEGKLEALKISGCPYTCKQIVYLLSKNKKAFGWMNNLF